MGSSTEKVTKLHLQAFGFSDYVIKQLIKGLNAASTNNGLKEYISSDIKTSVEKRLANCRIQAENQENFKVF
ncbi:MAG: hypothetical protein HC840_09480 [Leptolyngbyaceae cyanobacterium RM2_2_4]|nr:hypothetical protein [Leptolyngbyaceae cyanobacterium RM2_2_4]